MSRVFISYAHESPAHVEAVRQLWTLLRANGVDARLDLPATAQRQDWVLWMLEQFRRADYVIVAASAAYRRRADGEAAPDEGRGVQFEGAVLRDLYYGDRPTWTRRVLPVILPGESRDGIPMFLGPATSTSYPIKELSVAGIEELIGVITGRSAVVEPPLRLVPRPAGAASPHRPLAELSALADAFGALPEFASAPARHEALLLLPPHIRGAVSDAPNARLHIVAMIQACARFGEAGREALLDILYVVLPAEDPAVRHTTDLVRASTLFA